MFLQRVLKNPLHVEYFAICKSNVVSLPQDKLTPVINPVDRLGLWSSAYQEQKRLWASPRVERITVDYVGPLGSPTSLKMTKGISTPADCAKHLSEVLLSQSAIALVNGVPWDMYGPLLNDCHLNFVHFKDSWTNPSIANSAFWRSAAFLLAATLESAFSPEHQVKVISLPPVDPQSGGFVCDIRFNPYCKSFVSWLPSPKELFALSTHGQRMATSDLIFEPLSVPLHGDLFESLFSNDPLRKCQIERKVKQSMPSNQSSENTIIKVYRMGSFIEAFPFGPLIRSTGLIGRFSVSSFKLLGPLRGAQDSTVVYRVQGVALPSCFITHFTTFERLIQWSRQPNTEVELIPDYVENTLF